MEISREAIEEYKRAYKEIFGRRIPDKSAQEQAFDLLSLFKIIYRPIPEEKKKEMEKIIEEYKRALEKLV